MSDLGARSDLEVIDDNGRPQMARTGARAPRGSPHGATRFGFHAPGISCIRAVLVDLVGESLTNWIEKLLESPSPYG